MPRPFCLTHLFWTRGRPITPTLIFLHIIAGVCLLLWGLRGVKLGVTRAFGQNLHAILARSTRNRYLAFLSGLVATALLQSAMATAMIVASFCGRKAMTTAAGIAVVLGADVGTTLVAQVLTFDLSWLAPLVLIAGFFLLNFFERRGGLYIHGGKMLIGLALMMMALGLIKQAAAPLKDSDILPLVITALDQDPLILVLIGAALTWLFHSSLAIVLLLGTLAGSGVVPLHAGLIMVLGANLGGTLPTLMSTLKDEPEASRVPFANLIIRMVGVILFLAVADTAQALLALYIDDPARLLVTFHMAFNIILAILFLPFCDQMAKLVQRLMPDTARADDPGRAKYLDEKEITTPKIALSSAGREALRMADMVQSMMEDTIVALRMNDESIVQRIRARDDILDKLHKAIKMYMARITQSSLDPGEAQQYLRVLSFATNMENIGDIVDKSLMEMALRKIHDHKRFSPQGWQEIQDMHNFVMETVRLAQSVFVTADPALARRMIEGKEKLRRSENELTHKHMERIREGIPETIATSSLHLDIIRDYKRINSYLCAVAYPILEEAGQLQGSALKATEKPAAAEGSNGS